MKKNIIKYVIFSLFIFFIISCTKTTEPTEADPIFSISLLQTDLHNPENHKVIKFNISAYNFLSTKNASKKEYSLSNPIDLLVVGSDCIYKKLPIVSFLIINDDTEEFIFETVSPNTGFFGPLSVIPQNYNKFNGSILGFIINNLNKNVEKDIKCYISIQSQDIKDTILVDSGINTVYIQNPLHITYSDLKVISDSVQCMIEPELLMDTYDFLPVYIFNNSKNPEFRWTSGISGSRMATWALNNISPNFELYAFVIKLE